MSVRQEALRMDLELAIAAHCSKLLCGLRGFSLQRTARGDYGDTHRANYGWRRQSTPAVAALLDVVSPHKSPGKHERHQDDARGDCFEILGEGRRDLP